MNKGLIGWVAAVALVAAGGAYAAGAFPGYPAFNGGSSNTSPLTGNETIPADTNLGSGINPATELLLPGALGAGPHTGALKNLLIGAGDFGQNLWQRGTSFTGLHTAGTYTADRWAISGGSSSAIEVIKETASPDIPTGYAASARFGRNTGSNTAVINIGQEIASTNMIRLQGASYAVFSFYGYAPTTFSSSGYNINVQLVTGTVADEGTSAMFGGTWTGYAAAAPVSAGSTVSGTGSGGVTGGATIVLGSTSAAIPLTATWNRYWVAFKVPTGALEMGVILSYTPVGTASSDYMEFTGAQLEGNSAGVPTPVERITAVLAAQQQLAYYWEQDEAASTVVRYATCEATSSTAGHCYMPFPVPMRAVPTGSFAQGTLALNIAGTPTALSAAPTLTSGGSSTYGADITTTVASGQTGGQVEQLQGGNSTGGGKLAFTAEL